MAKPPANGFLAVLLTVLAAMLPLLGACATRTAADGRLDSGAAAAPPAASVGASASTPSAPAAVKEPRRISVAYPTNGVTMTGFYIAIQEGYTAEEGLDAQMVLMNGTASAQSMVAKQIDFGMSAGALLAAYVRGAPFRNIFVQIDKPLYFLYAQPDLTPAALQDKPVGIAAVGDSTHLATKAALKGLGVDPERVTYAANLSGNQAVVALQSGAVAAANVSPPFDLNAMRLGFRSLAFMGDYVDYMSSGLATHEDIIREQPDLVLATVRAELKAHRFMQENRAGTVQHMARYQDMSLEDAEFIYDAYMRYFTRDGTSSPEVLERMLSDQRTELQQQGAETRLANVDEAFRLEFARQANEQLQREGWQPRSGS